MPEVDELKWKRATGIIWAGALANTIAAFLFAITIVAAANIHSLLLGAALLTLIVILLGSAILIAVGLADIRRIVATEDAKAVQLAIIGFVIYGLSHSLCLYPTLSILFALLNLAAGVLLMIGFFRLKDSLTFPYQATQGANLLFSAFIVSLVGGFIVELLEVTPPAASVITTGTVLVALSMQLAGWYKFKTADPSDYLEKYTPKTDKDPMMSDSE